ncbi:unnamed protein product [Allacma fusca]|uniref:Uncharacterized protein n=1 Tax=Allacma fusca TaxID=39272 RepID=A0A8J2PHA5_9HEXA|nr:unnamed protein product [Allacma fusca]
MTILEEALEKKKKQRLRRAGTAPNRKWKMFQDCMPWIKESLRMFGHHQYSSHYQQVWSAELVKTGSTSGDLFLFNHSSEASWANLK